MSDDTSLGEPPFTPPFTPPVAPPGAAPVTATRIDEEDMRFTTGFADIFTAILLVVGGSMLAAFGQVIGGIAVVGLAVLLTPALVQRRQFAACAIVLAIGIAGGTALGFAWLKSIAVFVPVAAACALYWYRFRVPLALALAWIAGAGFVVALGHLGTLDAFKEDVALNAVPGMILGIILFAAAMWYDTRDRMRVTRLSAVAFWLHLVSAPLFVHGLFTALGVDGYSGSSTQPVIVLAVFAVLTLVSLIIDRRPLLASSFVYLVFATAALIRGQSSPENFDPSQTLRATMAPALIGVVLLALAAAWTPLRRMALALVPAIIADRLAPAATASPLPPERAADLPSAETEPVRLVLGFNDLFVALGAQALFFGSVFVGIELMMMLGGGDPRSPAQGLAMARGALPWIPILVPAAAMWGVAEYFVRIRRMAWPAITSAFSFTLAAFCAGMLVAAQFLMWSDPGLLTRRTAVPGTADTSTISLSLAVTCVVIVCAIGVLANLAFWKRHRLPISFALAVAALLPLAFVDAISNGLLSRNYPSYDFHWQTRLIAFGLGVFALAVWWDRRDRARTSQRSDTAFWLHLLASVLVIPAATTLLLNLTGGPAVFLAGFVALIGVALVLDRRAPLVVALPFAISAANEVAGTTLSVPVSLVMIGALLVLAFRWDQVRRVLLRRMPDAVPA